MGFMEIISWIIFGFVAGAVAKMLMPGRDPGGFVGTIVIGVVGAFVGGLIGKMPMFGQVQVEPGFNLKSFLFAVGGSIILLIVYRFVKGKG
jgi:uncharacterized membrane protein YeaQ/YmgE (transglycosylase-associated protein family)